MHFTPSMPQWGPAPLERFPMQMPFDIQIDSQIQQALFERSVAYWPADCADPRLRNSLSSANLTAPIYNPLS